MSTDLSALNVEANKAAQKYMGKLAWPTILFALAVPAAAIATLVLFANGTIGLVIATPLLGALTYMSYTVVHEGAHGNISGNHKSLSWLNTALGTLNASFILVPFAGHRTEHLVHHRFTNDPDRDPDAMLAGSASNPLKFGKVAVQFLIKAGGYPFQEGRWSTVSLGLRAAYIAEIAVMIGWRLAFFAVAPFWEALALLVISYAFALYFLVYWFAYRPHYPYTETERYRSTAHLIAPKWARPIRWFWLGKDIHGIHHLFPRVPFYHYHALYRDIEPILRANNAPIYPLFGSHKHVSAPQPA